MPAEVVTWRLGEPGFSDSPGSPRPGRRATERGSCPSRGSLWCSHKLPPSHRVSRGEKGREEWLDPFPPRLNLFLEHSMDTISFCVEEIIPICHLTHGRCVREGELVAVFCGWSIRCCHGDRVSRDRLAGRVTERSHFNKVSSLQKSSPQSGCLAIKPSLVKNAHTSQRH